jgi:hypothetical protein
MIDDPEPGVQYGEVGADSSDVDAYIGFGADHGIFLPL